MSEAPGCTCESRRSDRPLFAWLSLLVFALLSTAINLESDGFLEADGVYHYLYSRFAFEVPAYFTDVWARPLRTAIYAVPAQLGGLRGVRVMSLVLAVTLALLAWKIARDLRLPAAGLAALFTLAQPLVLLHSVAELSELPFATLLAGAFWCYVRRWLLAASVLVGLLPLARPEGFGFLLLMAIALPLHRRARWLPLLVLPLVAWNHLGWELNGRAGPSWRWLIDRWPYSASSAYARGPLGKYIAMVPAIVSPLLLPATLAGVGGALAPLCRAIRRARAGAKWTARLPDHRERCLALVAVLPLGILVGHSLLHWRGLMGSSGEVRYLLVVGAFWGLLSAIGCEWIFRRFRLPAMWQAAAVASVAWLQVNHYWRLMPYRPTSDWRDAEQIVAWYRDSTLESRFPTLLAGHPGITFHLRRCPGDMSASVVEQRPPGTLYAWDPVYSLHNADASRVIRVDALKANGWREIELPRSGLTGQWRLFATDAVEAAPR